MLYCMLLIACGDSTAAQLTILTQLLDAYSVFKMSEKVRHQLFEPHVNEIMASSACQDLEGGVGKTSRASERYCVL